MNQELADAASSGPDVTPLIRRIQKALLDGRTLSIKEEMYTWAPREGNLPDIDPNDTHMYQAREAGVFRVAQWQSGKTTGQKWIRLCALDALDDVLGPQLRQLSEPAREALSADMTFQIVMSQEQEIRSPRRQAPGR